MTGSSATPSQQLISKLDTEVPHSARIWNYWLGGKDNFPADRQVGDQVRAIFPAIVENARASRAFLARAVRYLTGQAGIRQFLDIGTGLPTADNIHEVAQRIAPECRIVYVDNGPLVLAHARALLTSSPEGATVYIVADVRETDKILQEAARGRPSVHPPQPRGDRWLPRGFGPPGARRGLHPTVAARAQPVRPPCRVGRVLRRRAQAA